MSAWVVSKAHIDTLVSAALQLGGYFRGEAFGVYHDGDRTDVTRANADEIGARLIAECVASVSYRYPSDNVEAGELPGPCDAYYLRPYTFERTRKLSLAEIARAISCYDYQSCEHPEWEASWAHAFCRRLEQRTLASLPGYDDAPWGFEESDARSEAIG